MYHRPSSEGHNLKVMDLANEKEREEIITLYVSQYEQRYRNAVKRAYIDGIALGLKVARDKLDEIWQQS